MHVKICTHEKKKNQYKVKSACAARSKYSEFIEISTIRQIKIKMSLLVLMMFLETMV